MVGTDFFYSFVFLGKSSWKLTAEDPHAGGLESTNSSIKAPFKLKTLHANLGGTSQVHSSYKVHAIVIQKEERCYPFPKYDLCKLCCLVPLYESVEARVEKGSGLGR